MKEWKQQYRRILAAVLILCMTLCPQLSSLATEKTALAEPQIQAQGAVVIDTATGQILYGKNANTKYYPASITKLMTALLVIENCDLNGTER